jgi:very-short-patch-repair endonuclease
LLRALDEVAGPAVIRSEFESRFRSLCQEAGLPQAQTNYRLGRWELDAVFLEHGVAVELDSWRWHGGRWQFHRDRRKGLDISRAGLELIRLSWPQLKYDRAEVVEAIQYALARGADRTRAAIAA